MDGRAVEPQLSHHVTHLAEAAGGRDFGGFRCPAGRPPLAPTPHPPGRSQHPPPDEEAERANPPITEF